jgi:hypothetical protein
VAAKRRARVEFGGYVKFKEEGHAALGGVVLAMLLLGLVATWIPTQRALSVDPLILLREE